MKKKTKNKTNEHGEGIRTKSTRTQTGQDERRLFVDRPTRLEREVGNFLADPSANFVPSVSVQVVRRRGLVHQSQDLRLVRTINGRHGYVADCPEPTTVVQVFVLQPEKIPDESPVLITANRRLLLLVEQNRILSYVHINGHFFTFWTWHSTNSFKTSF